ncbi:phospholipase effector Tle1 domain-containing protein, partial [Vibrio algivorus]|uniref:phospholipase effector Tle1 domain-containing protein n=1 Tax=Vibrio algivorus TaxID=1667024 RepID=UPI00232D4720
LGTESSDAFNPNQGYEVDSSKAVSVRFVGLFDTVGSFYLPGNQDNGQFKLALEPDCAQTIVQLTAHHEYRHNFPLTSLAKGNAPLPTNFYQEVFPGAHSDVGGGYPWQAQYNKTDLPPRYGIPTPSTYNLEEVDSKQQNLQALALNAQSGYEASSNVEHKLQQEQQQWSQESLRDYQQYGLVTLEQGTLHYYRKQPISSALCGLAQERMKQQAEIAGVKWEYDLYHLPKDFEESTEMQALNAHLLAKPTGDIDVPDWLDAVSPIGKTLIHRPHDAMIHSGTATAMEWLV